MTRARARRVQDALVQFMIKTMEVEDQDGRMKPKLILKIQAKEEGKDFGLVASF